MTSPCKGCAYAYPVVNSGPKILGQAQMLECRRFPPSVTPILGEKNGVMIVAGIVTVYPQVTVGCHEYMPKHLN